MVATLMEQPVVVKKRAIAPGEVELAATAALQFIAALALLFATPSYLAGNGTALLTASGNYPLKVIWAVVFGMAGYRAIKAIQKPSIKNRRIAWQIIIPLWACWWTGLAFPLVIGRDTNIIVLAAVFFLINQWIITRMFVPLNGHWYDREVIVPGPKDDGH